MFFVNKTKSKLELTLICTIMGTITKHLKSIIFVLIMLFISLNAIAQSGWVIQNSGTTGNLSFVYFINENTGFAGNPSLKTTNGGINWELNLGLPGLRDMSFINNNTGFAVNGNILKTTNSGMNWMDLGNSLRYYVEFVNDSMGFAAGGNYGGYLYLQAISRTTNAGVSWDSVIIGQGFAYNDFFTSLTMYNAEIGYAARYIEPDIGNPFGLIYKTTNSFNGWMTSFNRDFISMKSICIPKIDTVFCVGDYSYVGPPQRWFIYRAINDVWTILDTSTVQLTDMFFTGASTGYVVGYGGLILKTTNGGLNWRTLNSGIGQDLWRIYFVNQLTGYIVGTNGLILKTTTGGEAPYTISGTVRYQDNNQPVSSGYVKAIRYDEQTQNVITVDSTGIQSNGTYMLIHCPPIPVDIMAFQDDEEDASYVPTYYVSTIYWENAASVTADTNLTGIDIGVYRINNIRDNKHIGGTVYRAGNKDLSVLKDAIIYARIGNEYKGYSITGYPGTYQIDSLSSGSYELIANRMGYYSAVRPFVLTTFSVDTIDFVLNSLLVSIEPNGQIIPEKFFLSQNYPNPFNPTTKIKFGLPIQSHAKLTVYDVLGREVWVLVNEELKAGEYNVEWNATILASGIYFYRLEADNYSVTRKMVLIK
jgi:hypothetical protein